MNILLDHQLDQKLKDHIVGHNVTAAGLEGLQQIANGRLLAAAKKAGFDLFLTGDKNILFQNNIQKLPITVIQLPSQKLSELEPILPFIQKAVDSVQLDNGFYELNEAGDLKKHSERPPRKERRRRKTTHWLLLPKNSHLQKQALNVSQKGKDWMEMSGDTIVEEATVGDYELFVMQTGMLPDMYQIGMQRAGQDAFDLTQQMEKTPGGMGRGSLREMTNVINRWLQKYDELVIASHDSRKTAMYIKFAKTLGFHVEYFDFMGMQIPYISGQGKRASFSRLRASELPDTGPHGPIFREFSGKPTEAIRKLQQEKTGEVPDVWINTHVPSGKIGLVWGIAGDPNNDWRGGYGLAHIIAKHVEEQKDFKLEDLPALVPLLLPIQTVKGNRLIMETPDHRAVISLDWFGRQEHWIITAYEPNSTQKKQPSPPEGPLGVPGTSKEGSVTTTPLREGRFSIVSKRHFLGNKTSFMSPRTGELTIVVQHSMPERVAITLDMGIPRFTRFSITFPTNGVSPEEVDGCSKQAFDVLLDDLTAFLLSMHYEQNEIAGVIRLAAECFAEVNESHATDAKMKVQDSSIRMYQSRFELPESFIQETHARVMTAALVRRVPPVRMLNLVPLEEPENHPGRVIGLMGEQSTHSTPLPFEVRVEEKLIAPPLLKAKDWRSRLLKSAKPNVENQKRFKCQLLGHNLPGQERTLLSLQAHMHVDTLEEAKLIAAQFPKYLRVRTSTLIGVKKEDGTYGTKGVVKFDVWFGSDGVNKGSNETGYKRLEGFIRACDRLGYGLELDNSMAGTSAFNRDLRELFLGNRKQAIIVSSVTA